MRTPVAQADICTAWMIETSETALQPGAPVSLWDVLLKNLIPVTIGNAIAGALVVAVSMSFAFGRLGKQRN